MSFALVPQKYCEFSFGLVICGKVRRTTGSDGRQEHPDQRVPPVVYEAEGVGGMMVAED